MALLIVRGLAPGRPVPSPVYLDANVLVSYFVRRTNSPAAVQAIAELLAQGVQTILSPLTISEFWWAIFDALYNHDRQSRGEPPQRLTPGEYRRHRAELHGRYRVARGEADAPDIDGRVYVRGKVPLGEFARVRIVGHTDYDLIAGPA